MQNIIFIPTHKSPWRRHPSNPKIILDASDTVGSSLMRACIPFAFMKRKYNGILQSFCSRILPEYAKKNDIVIFVKDRNHPHIKESKKRGCITVYDPIDSYCEFNNDGKFDIMIASCDAHAEILSKRHSIERSKIIVIDVLHSNVNREKSLPKSKDQITVVGSVNPGDTAMLRKEVYQDLVLFGKDNQFEVKNVNSDLAKFSLDYNTIKVNNLFECYKDIHIGLALYDPKDLDYDRVNQKPSTKISGYASYDIPVICTYQKSMDKIIDKFPDFKFYIAKDVTDAKSIMLKLVKDYDFYLNSRKLFHDIGEMFHMDHSFDLYVKQINEAYGL